MLLSEYLVNTAKSDKNIQVINGNYDVLYYGPRNAVHLDCLNLAVIKEENILNAADVVTVEYAI